MIGPVVPLLPRHPAFHRLDVVEGGLRVDREAPRVAADLAVPRPEVTVALKDDFRAPAKAWMEPASKSLDEPLLGGVPNGIAGGVRTETNVQPDGGPMSAYSRTDTGRRPASDRDAALRERPAARPSSAMLRPAPRRPRWISASTRASSSAALRCARMSGPLLVVTLAACRPPLHPPVSVLRVSATTVDLFGMPAVRAVAA